MILARDGAVAAGPARSPALRPRESDRDGTEAPEDEPADDHHDGERNAPAEHAPSEGLHTRPYRGTIRHRSRGEKPDRCRCMVDRTHREVIQES